jgi:hypothetical protein
MTPADTMPPPYGDCAGLPGLERVLRGVGTDRRRAHRRAPGQWWAGTGRRPALKIADVVFSSCGRRSGPPRDSRKSPARRPGGVVAAPVIRVEALGRLPDGPAGSDPFWRLAAAFLVAYPDSTARAYLGDLKAWAAWCADRGVHPSPPGATTSTPGSSSSAETPSPPPGGRPRRPRSPGGCRACRGSTTTDARDRADRALAGGQRAPAQGQRGLPHHLTTANGNG